MSRECPTCESVRCGNHAACARRAEAAKEKANVWQFWIILGLAEVMVQRKLSRLSPFARRVAELNADILRVAAVEWVLSEMDRRRK